MPFGMNIGAYQYNGADPGLLNIGAYQGYPDVPVPPEPPTPPPEVATRRVVQSHIGIHISLGSFRWWVKNLFGLKPAIIYIVSIFFL